MTPSFLETCITLSVCGLHTLFKDLLMWHEWFVDELWKLFDQRETFICLHRSDIVEGVFKYHAFQFRPLLSFILISPQPHKHFKACWRAYTNVFYRPIQYKLAKQYTQFVPVIVTEQLHPSGWHVDLTLQNSDLQGKTIEEDIQDTHSHTGLVYSVSSCRFSHQYQLVREQLGSLNKTSLSVCSCSFRHALLGCMT